MSTDQRHRLRRPNLLRSRHSIVWRVPIEDLARPRAVRSRILGVTGRGVGVRPVVAESELIDPQHAEVVGLVLVARAPFFHDGLALVSKFSVIASERMRSASSHSPSDARRQQGLEVVGSVSLVVPFIARRDS